MLEPINYEYDIEIKEVPIQWIPLIELFSPSVPQYPLMYIHLHNEGNRIYGFPTHFSVKDVNKTKKDCTLVFNFISNKNLEKDSSSRKKVEDEIKNRIGMSGKIGLTDLKKSCNGNKDYEIFVEELWKNHVSVAYGDFLPFGRFYDEMYSIMRFLAALAPMSGGKSEAQMVYDFMSNYGERIQIKNEWEHFEFFLIPTYEEVLNKKGLNEFPLFESLYNSILKFGNIYFTRNETSGNIKLKLLGIRFPQTGEKFRASTSDMIKSGILTQEDKKNLDFLVDAYNRMPMRAVLYMGAIINITKDADYRKWDKKEFLDFYINKDTRGFSMKCAGCFLQQGFGNREVIPIDTWVESFFNQAMGIFSKEEIIEKFSDIGRFERLIWLTSQARKTNMKLFFDILWCIRFGTTDKDSLRGPNPISCFECKLRDKCIGYKSIKNEKIFIQQGNNPPSGHEGCLFIVGTLNNVPKTVFIKKNNAWKLIDYYSGYILHKPTSLVNKEVTVDELIKSL